MRNILLIKKPLFNPISKIRLPGRISFKLKLSRCCMLSTLNLEVTRLWKFHIFQRKSWAVGRYRWNTIAFFPMTFFLLVWVQAARAHQKVWCREVRSEGRWQEDTAVSLEPPLQGCWTLCPDPTGPLSQCWQRCPAHLGKAWTQHISHLLKVRVCKIFESYPSFFQGNVLYASQLIKCPKDPFFFFFHSPNTLLTLCIFSDDD